MTKGQEAIVDPADYDRINQWKWCAAWCPKTKSFYAHRTIYLGKPCRADQRTTVRMHRVILGLELGDPRQVDHLNHDTLDNRRENLRIVSNAGNQANRRDQSRYGVGIRKIGKRFCVRVQVNGRQRHIGMFDNLKAARSAQQLASQTD